MKKAIVTGINGMDGRFMAKLLLGKGYEVYGLARTSLSFETAGVKYIYGDLANSEDISKLIMRVEPDEIYNLGAQSHIKLSWSDPKYTLLVNGASVIDFMDCIRRKFPYTKFFNAASSEIFGYPMESPQCEETKLNPRNPYGTAKLYAYNMVKHYREKYGIFACSGILFNHESELRSLNMVTRKITNSVARIHLGLTDKIILGDLDATRDWGYAGDYVNAMWMILHHKKADDYVISTGKSRTIKDFLDTAFSVVGISDWNKYVTIDSNLKRHKEKVSLVGDCSKLKRIGWRTITSFNDMVTKMVMYDIKELQDI